MKNQIFHIAGNVITLLPCIWYIFESFYLYQYSATMIYFMLYDLRDPAGIHLSLLFEINILVLHFNLLIPHTFSHPCQRQTPFFRLIHPGLFDDLRIIHQNIHKSHMHSKIFFRTPIIFAAIPTHSSSCAFKVSKRSIPVFRSVSVAGSDGWFRKKISLIIGFTIIRLHNTKCLPMGHITSVRGAGSPVTDIIQY